MALLKDTHPHIAAEVVDPSVLDALTTYSNKKIAFRCPEGHTYETVVNNKVRQNSKCPYCSGRLILAGFNDLATTHPHLAAELIGPSQATEIMAGSGKIQSWQCSKNPEHTWKAKPNNRSSSNSGCPVCKGLKADSENNLLAKFPKIAAQLADPQPDGTSAADFAAARRPHSNDKALWVCNKHNTPHTWTAQINSRTHKTNPTGCPMCAKGTRIVDPSYSLESLRSDLIEQIIDPQPNGKTRKQLASLSLGSHEKITWSCSQGHTWITSIKDRVRGTNCPQCVDYQNSKMESDLAESINQMLPDTQIIRHAPTESGKHHYDILIPEFNIAIEFNGLYWHSTAHCNNALTRHRDKSHIACKNGIQLIHIWSDDWIYRRDVVLATLAHKLKAYDRLPGLLSKPEHYTITRRHARALEPRRTTSAQARVFAERHHLQGFASGTYHLSLFDGDNLAALMTLRSPSNNARIKRKPGQWEIQRFCVDGPIPGAFSKLLAFAEKTIISDGHELNSWISISSADISNGSLYACNGFKKVREIRPNYWYVGGPTGNRRAPKESFQKRHFRDNPRLLWEEGWTEKQAAEANGIYRVYDAGKIIWSKEIDHKEGR